VEVETAFELLRHAARSNRLKLHDLVARVRPNVETPPEVLETLRRRTPETPDGR
jgi:hypothetical protein